MNKLKNLLPWEVFPPWGRVIVCIVALILIASLAACGQVEQWCDGPDSTARVASREALAREGVLIKCVEPGSSWADWRVTKI